MNVKARIFARKILLVYFYEQYFFDQVGNNSHMISDVDKIKKLVVNPGNDDSDDLDVESIMKGGYYDNFDEEIAYIIDNHFKKIEKNDIDFEYIRVVGPLFGDYKDKVRTLVNKYAISFKFDEMDLMDRVLFILGYCEFIGLKTPKEIILNEMVELAKRYGDTSSAKLLNGIGHKILTDEEE